MPAHVVLAHVAAMLAPIAAVLAIVYAAAPSTRRGLRWPMVIVGVSCAVLIVLAGNSGHVLLDSVRFSGSAAQYEAAYRHAKSSDLATVAAVVLAVVAPLCAWRLLRPGETVRSGVVARIVLALCGTSLLAAVGYTVALGLGSVWGMA